MSTVQELQQRAASAESELDSVRAQIATLERSLQATELSRQQIQTEAGDGGRVWQGVGKMFMATTPGAYDDVVRQRTTEVREQTAALQKKKVYFETTLRNLTKALKEVDVE